MKTDTHRHVAGLLGEPTTGELVRVALALPGWDESARDLVARRLSELCSCRVDVAPSPARRLAASAGSKLEGVIVTLAARESGAPCAWLELEGTLARALVDMAIGGTQDTADLAHVEPLDATRMGILLYMMASTLAAIPEDALRVLDVRPAAEVPRPARLGCATRVTIQGRGYGALLTVDVSALPLPSLTPQRLTDEAPSLAGWARALPCIVSVELASGALDGASLASLEAGDVLIPDQVWAEPGPWERAALCCDVLSEPLGTLRLDPEGRLHIDARGPTSTARGWAAGDTSAAFTIEAARVQVNLAECIGWLREGRVPLTLDPHAPLTLWVAGDALARGRFVRDRSEVGLGIESVRTPSSGTLPAERSHSSEGSPNTCA